jgi:hypothetical protein
VPRASAEGNSTTPGTLAETVFFSGEGLSLIGYVLLCTNNYQYVLNLISAIWMAVL